MKTGLGTVLVLGGAACVWSDLDSLERMIGGPWPGVVIVVNDMGYQPGHNGRVWDRPVHHWATLHAEKLVGWKTKRVQAGLPSGFQTWSSVRRTVVDYHFTGWTNGSSGLYGVSVGLLALRHPRAVTCGIPMDSQLNTFSKREWASHLRYRKGWEQQLPILKRRVRSLSGWTSGKLGAPTFDWIGLVPPAIQG